MAKEKLMDIQRGSAIYPVSIVSLLQPTECLCFFHPISNDKILDWSKWKAFTENKLDMAQIGGICRIYERADNIIGNGENASILPFSPHCFRKTFSSGLIKFRIC